MAKTKSIIGRLLRPTRIEPPPTDDAPAEPRCPECGTFGSTRTPLLKIAAKKWARRGRILIFALFALMSADRIVSGTGSWTAALGNHIGSLDELRRICPEPVSDDDALALLSHIQAKGFGPHPGHALDRLDVEVRVTATNWRYEDYDYSQYTRWGWPEPWVVHSHSPLAAWGREPAPLQVDLEPDRIDIIDRARSSNVSIDLASISVAFCLLAALAWCTAAARWRLRLLLQALGVVSLLCVATRSIEREEFTARVGIPNPALRGMSTGATAADVLSNDRQSRIDAGRRFASVIHRPDIPLSTCITVSYESRFEHVKWGASLGVPIGFLSISANSYPTPEPIPAALELNGAGLSWSSSHSGGPSDSRLRIGLGLPSLAWYIAVIVIAGWIIRIAIWQIGKRVRPDWAQPRFACRKCGYDLSNTPAAPATDT